MYEQFFGLKEKPFGVTPDPKFIYWASPHSMAYTMLEYGVVNHASLTVVTGEIGSGKTTLIRHLLTRLPEDVNFGLLSNVVGDYGDLVEWVLMAFDQEVHETSRPALYRQFVRYLTQQQETGRRTVLMVDEAQNLGAKSLEALRLLTNLNTSDSEYLQIVLTGQPELKDLLNRPELVQFAQRVSSDFHLGLLDKTDVSDYIDHRLLVAGAQRKIFTPEACELIADATNGTPRLINVLCDTALLYGFAKGAPMISDNIVAKVLNDKNRHGIFQMHTDNKIGPRLSNNNS